MYEEYWELSKKPFQNTPDHEFLYLSSEHEEALMRMRYAVQECLGAAMLSGVFGCGKTMLVWALLAELGENYKSAVVSNPALDATELLREICYQFGIKEDLPHNKTDLMHLIDRILRNNINDGKDTVVIIDEAHLIGDMMVFEELRLLLNLHLKDRFLLTLILVGQPELEEKITNNKQLSQRIAIKYHLDRLNKEDTKNYIYHRLKVAGRTEAIFNEETIGAIFEVSGGIPRRINHICAMSLVIGFGRKVKTIDASIVKEAAESLVG
ncbi:AAA family ATPase [candidate division NPL-UPA2 bacterium Unc8]|uniref:AAA family ATPase n=1 Tax=candidate division NPL-UPA2 bacterium Unc8 TaxID=1980939 RepID=A0A399FXC1_UNCN2|nr:hypothetical protein [Bacillota bacterium]MBT9138106.1 hypothetical protein [Bacillota bacterium]MBT9146743.1 hypothetical protein [Bacillota bacterium]RII00069.1 MAG: AAA family ATPase [candidate division NPL-UPA2 bacterium Unc8]